MGKIQALTMRERLARIAPILEWLPHYQRSWLLVDFLAVLTVVALLIPEGLAYAGLAGMPPDAVFLAAPIGLILYAVFGTSRHLVVAVSSGVAVMSAAVVSRFAIQGSLEFAELTYALAILTGVFALLFGVFKLGRIARFFSESVLTGFIFSLALLIWIKQLPKVFGLQASEGNFWQRTYNLIIYLPESNWLTVLVGLGCLAVMVVLPRRFRYLPAELVTLIFGILLSLALSLQARGVEVIVVIPRIVPKLVIPAVPFQSWVALAPGILGIALVLFAESVGPSRDFASKYNYSIDENQELIGLGAANIGAGLFQGFTIASSLSKSAANETAGAESQASGLWAALVTILVGLFLTRLFAPFPEATLAVIVIVAVSGVIGINKVRRMFYLNKQDFWVTTITFLQSLPWKMPCMRSYSG